jgi:hypothetical protein
MTLDEHGGTRVRPVQPEEFSSVINLIPRFNLQFGEQREASYPLDSLLQTNVFSPQYSEGISSVSISANGLDREQVGKFWDGIALTPLSREVITRISRKMEC